MTTIAETPTAETVPATPRRLWLDLTRKCQRANITKAVRLGIPLRVGVIVGDETQRAAEARRELAALGVTRVRVDHVRPFGRGGQDKAPDMAELCGSPTRHGSHPWSRRRNPGPGTVA